MKNSSASASRSSAARRLGLAATVLFAMAQISHGAALTWDTTVAADGVITAGDGTWTNGAGNWNSGATSAGINWNNATPDGATFGGTDGAYAITVGGPITANALTFSRDGYTLSAATAQTITMTGATAVFAGETATIGSNVTLAYAGSATFGGGSGTLNITGAGATLAGAGFVTLQSGITIRVGTGALLTSGQSLVVGGNASGGNLIVDGGTVQVASQNLNIGGNSPGLPGTVTLTSGNITLTGTTGLRFGANAANSGTLADAVFNLDGGTLTAQGTIQKVAGVNGTTATFNFNGGTLKASSAALAITGLDHANVKAGGAIIDTNGFNITTGQLLKHDAALGATADGGLTKLGGGTLTLNGSVANTFNGGVNVNGGTLGVNLGNLATPTNLLNNANALSLSGGTLLLTGKTGVSSSQAFAGTSIGAGNSTVSVTANSGATTTAALGTVSQSQPGGVVSIQTATGAATGTSLAVATASNPAGYIGAWAFVGDSKTANARWANVDGSGRVVAIGGTTATSGTMSNLNSATTVYTAASTSTYTLGANQTAFGIQNTVTTTYDLGAHTLTTEGLLALNSGQTATVTASTGTLRVGAGNELVVAGAGNVTISAPISNKAASDSHVTYAGGGTLTLSGANTHSGLTSANSGTLAIANNLALQNSALNTSVAGAVTLSVNTPTLGGLTGSRNLSSVFTSGYGSVSALTLNPGVGASHTYFGVIADGAAGMTLTKTGEGTQILSGANTYTGATTISAGTLALGASNVFSDSSVLVLDGGTLSVGDFSDAMASLDLTSAGGTITLGDGAFVFGGSAGNDWDGGILSIGGSFVSGSSIRFGTDSSGLSPVQLGLIQITGFGSFGLDSGGYLVGSAIPEPSSAAALAGLGVLGLAALRRRRR